MADVWDRAGLVREVTQCILTGTGRLATDVPMTLPDVGRDRSEELGMILEQASFEEQAAVIAQGSMVEEELTPGRHPGTAIPAEPAARDQVMDVGMKDEGAAPGVEHPQHAQLCAEPARVGGQILESLGTGGKEQVQADLWMGSDEAAQFLRHSEGEQEVRDRQEQERTLALEPVVGVGLERCWFSLLTVLLGIGQI